MKGLVYGKIQFKIRIQQNVVVGVKIRDKGLVNECPLRIR